PVRTGPAARARPRCPVAAPAARGGRGPPRAAPDLHCGPGRALTRPYGLDAPLHHGVDALGEVIGEEVGDPDEQRAVTVGEHLSGRVVVPVGPVDHGPHQPALLVIEVDHDLPYRDAVE